MAKRRMFSIEIVESDAFCLMKASAQMLYFHLNMNADDDGVVDKWKSILRYIANSNPNRTRLKRHILCMISPKILRISTYSLKFSTHPTQNLFF